MDEQISSLTESIHTIKDEVKDLSAVLGGLNSSLTNEELEAQITELEIEVGVSYCYITFQLIQKILIQRPSRTRTTCLVSKHSALVENKSRKATSVKLMKCMKRIVNCGKLVKKCVKILSILSLKESERNPRLLW
jgi:hypothetical protein